MKKEHLEQVFNRPFKDQHENWKGNCPFHDEKTPSFFVHKEHLVAHCFGCGISGSIDVLAGMWLGSDKYEGRELLGLSNSDLLHAKLNRTHKHDRYAETAVFPKSWLAPWPRAGHQYVLSRGLHADTLKAVGARYDRCLKRQVFPHFNRKGELLGAIGRACYGQEPKWYFYWGYDKGQALWRAPGKAISGPTFVTEGIFDALWLYQNGVSNAVATLGTEFTDAQINELKSEMGPIGLLFDNDESGVEATNRMYHRLKKSQKVYLFDWPEHCKDAMDLTSEHFSKFNQYQVNYVQHRLRKASS